jgi:sugar lactone lactonase YvrE
VKRLWVVAVLCLCACPATGPITIPCRQNSECPTGYGCTSDGVCVKGSVGVNGSTLSISPQTANVAVGGTVQFTAFLDGTMAKANWSLDGGGAIDVNGLYTAPAIEAMDELVTVNAVSVDAPGAAANALVTVRTVLPVPQLSSITPNQAAAGSPDTMLSATGSDFVPTTELQLDGQRLDTTYVSATQLSAIIPAALLATGRTSTIVVVTPGLGGASAGASFLVLNPQAALGAVNPSSALAGAQSVPLVLTGAGFVPGAVVTASGVPLQATVVSTTQISATLAQASLAKSGVLTIAVRNPMPGGGGIGDQPFRIDPVIRTVAGGYTGDTGPANVASLSRVTYMAFHPVTGELYYSETERQRVMKIDVTGRTRKVAGASGCGFSGDSGPANVAALCNPRGLAFDPLGNLYIADASNFRIRKIDTTGIITTWAGTGNCNYVGEGVATAVSVGEVFDLKMAVSGNLYFSTSPGCASNARVRRISPAQMTSNVAGNGSNADTPDDGGVMAATSAIEFPLSIAVDPQENVYIAEYDVHRVKKVSVDGGYLSLFAGTGSAGNAGENVAATQGQLFNPRALAFDRDGGLVISSYAGNSLRRVNLTTGGISTWAGGTSGFVMADGLPAASAAIGRPSALALSPMGQLHFSTVSDVNAAPNTLKKIDSSGVVQPVLGPAPLQPQAIDDLIFRPYGVTVDAMGNMFVSDREGDRIYRVDTAGMLTVYAGNGLRGFGGDGAPAAMAQLSAPEALFWDSGELYFVDAGNGRVRKVDAMGMISTVAGGGAVPAGCSTTSNTPSTVPPAAGPNYDCFGDDYLAPSAVLISPRGIFKTGSTLYISEYETAAAGPLRSNRIRRVDLQTNVIETIAGLADYRGGTNGFAGDMGPAGSALLYQPMGMALDMNGDLVFADSGNHRLRRINLVTAPVGQINTIAGSATASSSGNGNTAAAATFRRPWGLVLDAASGNLYVSDFDSNNVRRIDSTGVVSPVSGAQGCGACTLGLLGDGAAARDALLAQPGPLALSPSGALLVGDTFNERVRAIGP